MKKKLIASIIAIQFVLLSTIAWAETRISDLPFTITKAGSYYVRGNQTVIGDGITVNADNVTIDFRGYTITGNGTGYGIDLGVTSNNIEIRDGAITNFQEGIGNSSYDAHTVRVINVRATGNTGHGIKVRASNSLVKNCNAANNGGRGIDAGKGVSILGSVAFNNVLGGFSANYGTTVKDNTAYQNLGEGFDISGGSTVIGNTAYENQQEGFRIKGFGITVINNTAWKNQFEGIQLRDGNCYLDGNTAYDNDQANGEYPNMSACATCTFGTNHAP